MNSTLYIYIIYNRPGILCEGKNGSWLFAFASNLVWMYMHGKSMNWWIYIFASVLADSNPMVLVEEYL